MPHTLKFADIKPYDISNGPGVRTSLFVSGCRNNCPGCFNKDAQDFNYGKPFFTPCNENFETLKDYLDRPEIAGLTILGGEPLDPRNISDVVDIVEWMKYTFPEKNIWLYTGYVLDEETMNTLFKSVKELQTPPGNTLYEYVVMDSPNARNYLNTILRKIDVLVDGPFLQNYATPGLQFVGSSNQRIISMRSTILGGEIYRWVDPYREYVRGETK